MADEINSSNCNHDCSSCQVSCGERKIEKAPMNAFSNVKKVIAVMSGKGGVGKSLTTALLAVNARRAGKNVAILDADVTGPSIPTIFGIEGMAEGDGQNIYPLLSKTGIKVMSLNLLLEDRSDPVIWRGPVVAGLIEQFWSDCAYGDIDELYVDMPPGTSDVPLTVFQKLPVDAAVVVTSPQELVSQIVEKAVKMASMMDIKVLGVVENMSYLPCPHCGERIYPFGEPSSEVASAFGIPVYECLPLDPKLASLCDSGDIESHKGELLTALSEAISALR
ncbi:MAG: P-loop NTPase [Candidatus Enteromonas sp.]